VCVCWCGCANTNVLCTGACVCVFVSACVYLDTHGYTIRFVWFVSAALGMSGHKHYQYLYYAFTLWHTHQRQSVDAGRSSMPVACLVHVRWWCVSLSCSCVCCWIMHDDAVARCHLAQDTPSCERETKNKKEGPTQHKCA